MDRPSAAEREPEDPGHSGDSRDPGDPGDDAPLAAGVIDTRGLTKRYRAQDIVGVRRLLH